MNLVHSGLTLTETEEIERLSNPYARVFLMGFTTVGTLILIIYFIRYLDALRFALAYVLPLTFLGGIVLVVLLYLQGRDSLPKAALISGWLFSVGGVALDAGATIINTPTLAREANVIARALLDSGHSIGFVYGYGIASQAFYLILVCGLWATFLRHRHTLIDSAMSANPTSGLEFIKAATGGAHLSWRQYFLPLKLSELPKSYHSVLLIAVTLTGSMMFNWYLGLSWMGVIPVSHPVALIICVMLSVTAYAVWLWFQYAQESVVQ
jgi:hypothetical protein